MTQLTEVLERIEKAKRHGLFAPGTRVEVCPICLNPYGHDAHTTRCSDRLALLSRLQGGTEE